MNLANLSLSDLAGMTLGFFLTLMVLSYVIGDNALFRVAIHIFIGVAAGYAAVVAWYNVIWPQLVSPAIFGTSSERMLVIFPLLVGVLMLFKVSPRFSALGNPSMAFLLGVGMATAVAGSILGTVLPQSLATMNLFDPDTLPAGGNFIIRIGSGSVILLGTLATLAYFHFGVRQSQNKPPARPLWLKVVAWVGQVFIAITFGVIFAGVYTAALTALIERVAFLRDFIFALGAS
jgi:hypothetical protein